MKKILLLLVLAHLGVLATAQQLQSSSFYDLQGVFMNPSMAGVQKHAMIGASYRTQWSGISGAPKTATLFGSFKLPKQAIGLGGYLYSDKTGPTSRNGLALSFAKHIELSKGLLSLGVEARMQQWMIDRNKLSQTLGTDPVLSNGDNKFKFDAGFGVSFANERLQVGASVSQLVQSELDFYSGNLTRSEQGRLYRHYYAHGAYKFDVDGSTTITPNFLLTYLPNAPLEFQGGARVEHKELFWWGLAMRARQSWLLSAGVHVDKKLTLGYSFEIYRTPLSIYDKGSNAHELILRYDLIK